MSNIESRLENLVMVLLAVVSNVTHCHTCPSCRQMAKDAHEFAGLELESIKKERERETS